tara:strand:+ start:2144 stop:2338 length:195 start_codon:yes stop_codon:yes gene_type:complete
VKMNITKQQWEAFKLTQKLAKRMMYDIFSPEAVRDSGLDKDTYMYIINHKAELHEQYDKGDTDE